MSTSEVQPTPAQRARTAFDEHLSVTLDLQLEPLKAGYAEDAVLHAPDGVSKGREAIGAWFSERAHFFRALGLRPERIEAREGFVNIDWWAGQDPEQPPITGRDEFDINDEGLIIEQRIVGLGKANRPPHYVRVEIEPPISRLVLDRDEKRNAVSRAMLDTMTNFVNEVAADPTIRTIVISGAGRDLSAGEDVKGFDFPDDATAVEFLKGPLG
ncbi:enoyl-CoA hydratase/isomerase family protein, partial [Thermodesulfobacteriota bacterium]